MTERVQLTSADRDELVATRRDLHRHPEPAYEEVRTAGVVEARLREIGYETTTGVAKTGVVATRSVGAPGRCVMLRADMDALPMQERGGHDYVSTVPNVMHACGHDCHTAIALTTARVMQRIDAPANGSIKLVFQPAEEIGAGAREMIEAGVLENPKVDAAFGLHVWNHLETGKVAVTSGPFMGSVDVFRIRIVGAGGHAAIPQDARDPVLAAAHVTTALQQIASRNVDPLKAVVVTVASIQAGDTFNIIPEDALLTGTLRALDDDVWNMLPEAVTRVTENTAKAFGCKAEVEIDRVNKPTINDPTMADLVRQVASDVVGSENVVETRTMGGEDFGEFLMRVPGCFFFVGSRNEERGLVHPHHSPEFDIDEDALEIGARLLSDVALRFLAGS